MSVHFKKWLNQASAGILTDEQSRELSTRFLEAAANDCGGERVYVPKASAKTEQFRMAMKLVELGFDMNDCESLCGIELSKSTFYDWRKKVLESKPLTNWLTNDRKQAGYWGCVYALQFEGPGGECLTKIGVATHLKTRLATHVWRSQLVFTGGAAMYLCRRYEGSHVKSYWVEAEAHRRFAAHRVEGEWFSLPGGYMEAADFIEETARPHFAHIGIRVV